MSSQNQCQIFSRECAQSNAKKPLRLRITGVWLNQPMKKPADAGLALLQARVLG